MSNLKVNTINDASGGSAAVLYGVASPPNSMGFRNRIINGDMRIDQRNAGASVTITNTAAVTYTLDRWAAYGSQASKFSVQQNAASVTPPTGYSNYLGATSLSAYSVGASENFTITQNIEGFNVADLGWGAAGAQSVTMSFWVRSSLTGTFGGALVNSAVNRSYPFSFTISAANTWEQKTVTIAGDTSGTWVTNNGVGIRVIFGLGVGSSGSGTAGAWAGALYQSATGATSVVGTSGATFYITGVQLEAGTVATPFERRPYTTEEQLCQRYGFDPIGARGGNFGNLGAGIARGSSNAQLFIRPPVTLRSGSPSITWSGNFNAVYGNSLTSAVTAILIETAATSASAVTVGVNISTGFTAGQMMFVEAANNQTAKAFISTEL